jgi:O-antigen/teichoic acid export membrane protein
MINTLRTRGIQAAKNQMQSRSARGALGTFVLTATFAGLSFVISIVLARLLGSNAYGAYAYAMAWVTFLITPALFGLDTLIVRQTAVYATQNSWPLARGILAWAGRTVFLVGSTLTVLVALGAWFVLQDAPRQNRDTFLLALILVPIMALARLRQAVLRGFREVVSGLWPETLVHPLLLLTFIGALHWWLGGRLNPQSAMGLNIVATIVAFSIGAWVLQAKLPAQMQVAPQSETSLWKQSAWPLFTLSLLHVTYAQVDMLLLGALKGVEVAGIYAMAKWLSGVIGLVVTAVNAVLAPSAASLYTMGNIQGLQNTVTKSARALLFLSLPLTLFLMLFGTPVLKLAGAEFARGQMALVVLCIGQLVNAAMGSVGLLLMMTGHERDAAKGIGCGALANAVLSALLIPPFGLEGAAYAASLSLILWNVVLAVVVRRRLAIDSTAFFVRRKGQ